MGEHKHREATEAVKNESADHSRTLWVVTVLAFWVSLLITVVVLFVTGKLNLILASVSLGLMILGVALKTRYQLKQRKRL